MTRPLTALLIALVVVISEESGLVSLAEGGQLVRGLSAAELRERLDVGTEATPVDLTTSGILPAVDASDVRPVVTAESQGRTAG